jgi:glucosamine--fructose-6-phosphate aminotransferase (isomerizing)
VVVSHRGTSRYAQEALQRARAAAAPSIAVTGKGSDGLAAADVVLRTSDADPSRAHTASYTSALAVLGLLAAEFGGDAAFRRAVDGLPDLVALLLGQESWEDLAKRFAGRRRYWFVGGGPNTATALEGALKMSETNYATALGVSSEQSLHGAWVTMTAEDLVVLLAPLGPSHARAVDVARVTHEIGAPLVAVITEGDAALTALAAETIELAAVPELLSPLLAVVPLQLLAYHLAVHGGTNPDTMRAHEAPHARALGAFTP